MKLNKIILTLILCSLFYSCAQYKNTKTLPERQFYSSFGFALIYEDGFYEQKIVNKKINNENLEVIHSFLKRNTPIRIVNPENLISVKTKVYRTAEYPKIFNVVVSKKIASILKLNINNPYVEIIEIKKNKTFIAKKSNTFEEEKNVAEKAPVGEIEMDVLSVKQSKIKKKRIKNNNFILVINDFYYLDSAENLMKDLIKKSNLNNLFVKKISDNKYRLLAGPFKNFNALKTTYISLNNLGFEDLNIYKE